MGDTQHFTTAADYERKNRSAAISAATSSLKLPRYALTEKERDNQGLVTSASYHEKKNRPAAVSAATSSLNLPRYALTEKEQDDQGLVTSASYHAKKSRPAALKAATASVLNSEVGDLYSAKTQYKPDMTTRSGALTGAKKANRQSLDSHKQEAARRKSGHTRIDEYGNEKPSYDLGFLYTMASTSAQADFYNANPALATENVANEAADRRHRASQAGITAMASNPEDYLLYDESFENDMARMQGADVNYVAERNTRDMIESMDDGGAAFREYYLSQLLGEDQPQPQMKKEEGHYLGAGTLRSKGPAEDNVLTPQTTCDSEWAEMSVRDRKKAARDAAKQNKLAATEAKKAEKAEKKKAKEMQKQMVLDQRHWEKQVRNSRRGSWWWGKRRNPERWPDWEGSFPVEDNGSEFNPADENEFEPHTHDGSGDEADSTRPSALNEENRSGRRSSLIPRLPRSVSNPVSFRNSGNKERSRDDVMAPGRSRSLDNRLGNLDLDKRIEDQGSLRLRARRNSQTTISEVDRVVFDKAGKAPSLISDTRSSWAEEEPSEPDYPSW